jgi:hypothetical protein
MDFSGVGSGKSELRRILVGSLLNKRSVAAANAGKGISTRLSTTPSKESAWLAAWLAAEL